MGTITMKIKDGQIIDLIPEGDTALELDSIISFCMSFMDTACKDAVKSMDHDIKEDFYDRLNTVFDNFLELVFPDVQPVEATLSDMAILYAQDQIIDKMHAEHITYEEALRKYEARAKEYVRQKRAGYAS